MTDKEKIICGECVSPMTVDRCSYCVDCCVATKNRNKLTEVLRNNVIERS